MKKILFTWVVGAVLITGATSCSGFLEEYSQDLAKVESWRDLDEVLLGDGYMQSGYRYSIRIQHQKGKETWISCIL